MLALLLGALRTADVIFVVVPPIIAYLADTAVAIRVSDPATPAIKADAMITKLLGSIALHWNAQD